MTKSKFLMMLLSLLLVGVLVFTGCGADDDPVDAVEEEEEEVEESEERPFTEIAWGGSSPGGGFYYAIGVAAPILTEEIEYLNVTNTATGASADNVMQILQGDLDFGLAHGSNAYEGWHGIGQFEGLDNENINVASYMFPSPHYFATLARDGYETLQDLEGKTIAAGQPGSGAQYNSDTILDVLGYDINREYLQFADAGRALVDGHVDAVGNSSIPVGAMTELSETQDITFLRYTDEEMEKLLDAVPFYYKDDIWEGAYRGIDEPFQAPFVPVLIIVHKDVPDYVVYDMLEIIYRPDVYEELGEGYGSWRHMKPGIDIVENLDGPPMHPGAIQFFEDFADTYDFDSYGQYP